MSDPPPHGGFHLHDGHSSLMDNIHRLGLPHISKRKPWCPQVDTFFSAFQVQQALPSSVLRLLPKVAGHMSHMLAVIWIAPSIFGM